MRRGDIDAVLGDEVAESVGKGADLVGVDLFAVGGKVVEEFFGLFVGHIAGNSNSVPKSMANSLMTLLLSGQLSPLAWQAITYSSDTVMIMSNIASKVSSSSSIQAVISRGT